MPLNVSADLLQLFKDLIGRTVTDVIQDPTYYRYLTNAQTEVFSEVVSIAPQAFYQKVGTSSLPTMSTIDHNVFTFSADPAAPIAPLGRAQIYRRPSDVPDRALRPDVDYLDEVTQIRLLRNRTYSGTLYWRGAVEPGPISATAGQAPAFLPAGANELTAIRAAKNFAEGANIRNAALADRMKARYLERRPFWCLVWKQQFGSGGACSYSLLDLVTVPGPAR